MGSRVTQHLLTSDVDCVRGVHVQTQVATSDVQNKFTDSLSDKGILDTGLVNTLSGGGRVAVTGLGGGGAAFVDVHAAAAVSTPGIGGLVEPEVTYGKGI